MMDLVHHREMLMLKHSVDGSTIHIETDALKAQIHTEGYTSGVASGTLLDKKTGATDLGFGLHIADFLLEPGAPDQPTPAGQYQYGAAAPVHGNIAKRYVEGPQICTQAKKLPYEIIEGDGFLAVSQWFTWHQAYAPHKAGSKWEQILIFPEKTRYFLSSDRITTVNECDELFMRIDMPGHIRHNAGDTFEHIYLSYEGAFLTSVDFKYDFAPDEHYLYRRDAERRALDRFIRAYQVKHMGTPGPWLAGMTLEPADVYQAWCHQRGYVCMIQEIGGRETKPGDTFGAAYAVGWFDNLQDMHLAYDKYRGTSGWQLKKAGGKVQFVGVQQKDVPPVTRTTKAPANS
ncbi:MAG: hypothetical protein O3C40_03610 [Planctomycetota bacterium]|nr:hypothetical protein [Planctomycetota bacterium]